MRTIERARRGARALERRRRIDARLNASQSEEHMFYLLHYTKKGASAKIMHQKVCNSVSQIVSR